MGEWLEVPFTKSQAEKRQLKNQQLSVKELDDCSAPLLQSCLSRQLISALLFTSMWWDFPWSYVLRGVGVSMPQALWALRQLLLCTRGCPEEFKSKSLPFTGQGENHGIFSFPLPCSFGVVDSDTWGCHELTGFCTVRLQRSWWRCCLQTATVLP